MKKLLLLIISSALLISNSNAQTWEPLGDGIGDWVTVMATYNDELYVGGKFNKAGDVKADNIAKWNGKTWSAVGEGSAGMNANVLSMAVYNGELYVGGCFTKMGGVRTPYIAKWNGKEWSPLGKGLDWYVYSLVEYKGDLYAGGYFSQTMDGIKTRGVAKWNGTEWSAVGTKNFNSSVTTMAVYKDELYIGGHFGGEGKNEDGERINHIARWDGKKWHTVGEAGIPMKISMTDPNNWGVNALCVYKDELYVGGLFHQLDGQKTAGFIKWDGKQWGTFGKGIGGHLTDRQVANLYVYNDELYLPGYYNSIDGVSTGFAKWDGTKFTQVNNELSGTPTQIEFYKDELYAINGGFKKPIKGRIAKYKK